VILTLISYHLRNSFVFPFYQNFFFFCHLMQELGLLPSVLEIGPDLSMMRSEVAILGLILSVYMCILRGDFSESTDLVAFIMMCKSCWLSIYCGL